MKTTRTNILGKVGKGCCLFLMAGLASCAADTTVGTEVVDDTAMEADAEVGVDTWDNNEFNSTFASNNFYEDWDQNDDNLLDQNEYNAGFYDTWDTNDDNQLDENEWNTAANDFGLENQSWAGWDTSGDGILDENEFGMGFGNSGWYNTWDTDTDGFIGEREYTDGLFGQWDGNDDGMLDTNEFGFYNSYFGM